MTADTCIEVPASIVNADTAALLAAIVTAALPLRISLSLDQVDATVVDRVVGSVGGKDYVVESPDSAEAIPHRREAQTVRTWCLRPRPSQSVRERPTSAGDLEARLRCRWELAYIRVYTVCMKVVKVRRVGNSNVVSLPRELEASGYVPGTSVLVEELPDGELRILPTDRVRERVRVIAARAVSERAEALEILAGYDADQDASR
jgi:antitoxin component of MazEF toxin-antitoxin module